MVAVWWKTSKPLEPEPGSFVLGERRFGVEHSSSLLERYEHGTHEFRHFRVPVEEHFLGEFAPVEPRHALFEHALHFIDFFLYFPMQLTLELELVGLGEEPVRHVLEYRGEQLRLVDGIVLLKFVIEIFRPLLERANNIADAEFVLEESFDRRSFFLDVEFPIDSTDLMRESCWLTLIGPQYLIELLVPNPLVPPGFLGSRRSHLVLLDFFRRETLVSDERDVSRSGFDNFDECVPLLEESERLFQFFGRIRTIAHRGRVPEFAVRVCDLSPGIRLISAELRSECLYHAISSIQRVGETSRFQSRELCVELGKRYGE